eukprot:TRINITY_DN90957_c0_g1_i1.p1 TRINITY_DN90957_c0_g1~~TRINITY_DN90957_c0_g1_i1.p1  ORF type:complete len:702 (-),score=115.06 TRINITY_DN90957_c0_g1_i1:215-2320(-)
MSATDCSKIAWTDSINDVIACLETDGLPAEVQQRLIYGSVAIAFFWCIGWLQCMPVLDCIFQVFKCTLVSARLLFYCFPCCRRRTPKKFWDGSCLGVCVSPQLLHPGNEPGQKTDGTPEQTWKDPMKKPDRLNIEPKAKCGGLIDFEAPLLLLITKAIGKDKISVDWKRAKDFFGDTPTLFGPDGPTPMDIEQGRIGDCYFLSACAALAEEPSRIKRLFRQQDVTEDGVYCVSLMKNGTWHDIWINDVFPTMGGKPVMCGSKETNKVWPLLLEKAYAVLYGTGDYLNIGEGGYPAFALHALSGCPTQQYDMRQHSREDLWQALVDLHTGRAAACAFCVNKPAGPYVMAPQCRNALIALREHMRCHRWCELLYVLGVVICQMVRRLFCLPFDMCKLLEMLNEQIVGPAGCSGICDGHAYSVLGTAEIQSGCGYERLVKLRNPWGEGEWRGRFSDGSSAWTEEAAAQVDLEKADDGAFWMELSDFEAYYACTAICHTAPTPSPTQGSSNPSQWHRTAYLLDLDEAGVADADLLRVRLRLVVKQKCKVFVTVDEFTPVKIKAEDAGSDDDDDTDEEDEAVMPGGFTNHAWGLLVFDHAGALVRQGRSNPAFRWMDLEWNARQDGGPFAEVASLSTLEMQLSEGVYTVVIAWSPYTQPGSIPKKAVCSVSSSLPGVELSQAEEAGSSEEGDSSEGSELDTQPLTA